MADYWLKTLRAARYTRRKALQAGAGAGAAALMAGVLACGGGNDEGGGSGSSGLAREPVDTTKQAVKGGTMQAFMTSEGLNFDAPIGTAQVTAHGILAYSRLLKTKLGTVKDPPDGSVEGDAASSWEQTPDGLQVTFKLRQGMKYDPRPPTNGRTINSGDVKYSWERFAELNPARGNWLSSIVPDAPVDRFEFPDQNTVVVKLTFPMGTILRRFNADIYVMPIEAAEKKFDPLEEMRGSGPWMMTKHERSVGWEYVRNPNWYMASERPFLDGVNYALLSEPTVQLAQFRAKRIWWLTPPGDQVVSVARDTPGVLVSPFHPKGSGANANYTITLSKLQNSPLQQDVRLRHAISLLLDRDAWIDTFYNVTGLEREGLPMQAIWNSTIAGTAPEWLDPKENKLGEDSKWFHHNPEEAAKLLRAAGKFGIEQDYSYATSGFTTPQTSRQMEVMAQMLQEGGHFKLNVKTGDYTAWAQPTFFRGRGQYEGISWTSGLQSGADTDSSLWGFYAPGARNDGIYAWDRVPGLEPLMKKERQEIDDRKRTELIYDIQKLLAKQMPAIMFPGVATTFNLYWPWMGNAGFYRVLGNAAAAPQDSLIHTWYDKSKQT